MNPLRKCQLYFFVKAQIPLIIRILFNGAPMHGKKLELGLKVYDQSEAHGHLKGQKLLFGWKRGYRISHNLQHYFLAHEYKSAGWTLDTSLLHFKLLGLER